jgi:hypothetical protein
MLGRSRASRCRVNSEMASESYAPLRSRPALRGSRPALGAEPRVIWAGVAAATVIGFLLRAVFLSSSSLGYEEVFTNAIAHRASVADVWRGVNATESTPPLYYVLTWLWIKLSIGGGAEALRFTSLLAGGVTVPVAFLAMRTFFDRRIALVVAWLCAISPIMIGYSIYARSYALLVMVCALSLWALGALLERQTGRRWTLWALAAIACLWTHYFTVFVIVGEVAVLVIALPEQRRRLCLSAGAVVIAVAPLWSLFSSQSDAVDRTAYIAGRSLATRLEDTVRQFSMGSNVPSKWLEGAGIAVVLVTLAWGVWRMYRSRAAQIVGAVFLAGAGLPILSAALGIDDHYLARNILGVWICLAPFAAYGLTRLRSLPLLVYSVICLVTVVITQTNWRYQAGSDWGGASARLQGEARGDPIAVMPGLQVSVPAFYLHRTPLTAPVHTANLWVMVEPARGPGQRALTPIADPPLAALWGSQFRAVGEIDYRGFRLIHLQASSPTTVLPAPAANGPATSPSAFVLAPG